MEESQLATEKAAEAEGPGSSGEGTAKGTSCLGSREDGKARACPEGIRPDYFKGKSQEPKPVPSPRA